MMGYNFNYLLSSLAWDFIMLITMLLPVVVIVGIVYLGLSLQEHKTKGTTENDIVIHNINCHAIKQGLNENTSKGS